MNKTGIKRTALSTILVLCMLVSCIGIYPISVVNADTDSAYLGKVKDVLLNKSGGAVIKENGELWVWPYWDSTTPVKIMDHVKSMSSGQISINGLPTSAFICEDDSLWIYGSSTMLKDDNGSTISADRTPYHVMDDVASVTVCPHVTTQAGISGGDYMAVIRNDGSLYMWGNISGLYGDGNTTYHQPHYVMGDVASVALGMKEVCAIKTNGELWTWGWDYRGSLGHGTNIEYSSESYSALPQKILDDVVKADICSYDDSAAGAALQSDGTLWTWGDNVDFALGNTRINSEPSSGDKYCASPEAVMNNIASITCKSGYYRKMAAVSANGDLYMWGSKDYSKKNPSLLMGDVSGVFFSQASNSYSSAYIIKSDGSLYSLGNNTYGQLGIGTTNDSEDPVFVMSDVSEVSSYDSQVAALQNDGTLWMWGYNQYRELGDGTTENHYSPVNRSNDQDLPEQTVFLVDDDKNILSKDSEEYKRLVHLAFAKFAYNNNKNTETITWDEVYEHPTVAKLIKERTKYTADRYYDDPIWKDYEIITNRGFYNSFIGDWKLVFKRFYNDDNGFCAYAFLSPDEKNIVIAYTGSQGMIEDDGSLGRDWDTDFWFAIGSELKGQFADATVFYNQVREEFPDCEISFTGHSLGGALAAYEGYLTGLMTYAFDGAVGHVSYLTMYRMPKEVRGFKGIDSEQLINLTDVPSDNYLSIADVIQNWNTESYYSDWYETGEDEIFEDDGAAGDISFEQGGYKHKIWTCLSPVSENMISFNHYEPHYSMRYASQDIHFSNALADKLKSIFDSGKVGASQRSSYVSQNTMLKGRIMLGTTLSDKISAPSIFIVDSTPGIRRNTTIFGGTGSDTLTGYTSNDTLVPGPGLSEKLDGQTGNDWYIIDPCPGQTVTIKDSGGKNNIVLRDFSPWDVDISNDKISLPDGQTVDFRQSAWAKIAGNTRFTVYYQGENNDLSIFPGISSFSSEGLNSQSFSSEGVKLLDISGTGTLEILDENDDIVCTISNIEEISESTYEDEYGYFYAYNDEDGRKLMAITPSAYSVRLVGDDDVALLSADINEDGMLHAEYYDTVALSDAPVVQVDEEGNAQMLQENDYGKEPLEGGAAITTPQFINAPDELYLVENESAKPDVTVLPVEAADTELIYSSDDEDIAVVSSDGVITGISEGTTWITITCAEDEEISTAIEVIVESDEPEYEIELSKNKTSIEVFGSKQLTVSYTPEDAPEPELVWSSSDPEVATVDQNGLVTALSAGCTDIWVETADGTSWDYCEVLVTFADVPLTHNFHTAVYWGLENGITGGYTDGSGKFGVKDPVTRGQVVMFLWRAAGKPEPQTKTQTFKDVPVKHNFYKAIQWAAEQGITGGYTGRRAGYFGPSDQCTRGQIVMFMWRYDGKNAPYGSTQTFPDVPVSHNFYKAVQWAAEQGITAGYSSGKYAGYFGINDNCTRGQCITFLYRLVNY